MDKLDEMYTDGMVRSICESKWYYGYDLMTKDGADSQIVNIHYTPNLTDPFGNSIVGAWIFILLKINGKIHNVTAYIEQTEAESLHDTGLVHDVELHTWLLNNRDTWKMRTRNSCDS